MTVISCYYNKASDSCVDLFPVCLANCYYIGRAVTRIVVTLGLKPHGLEDLQDVELAVKLIQAHSHGSYMARLEVT
jgi:hypothetical protein